MNIAGCSSKRRSAPARDAHSQPISVHLIDFKNLTSDTGPYADSGFVGFHDNLLATGGDLIVPGAYVQIALTRDGVTDVVSGAALALNKPARHDWTSSRAR